MKVGDGVCIHFWSDRKAATVIRVSPSGRQVAVRRDRAIRIDKNGMSECQGYSFHPDPDGSVSVFSLRKNGRWCEVGNPMRGSLWISEGRNHYHDYSF